MTWRRSLLVMASLMLLASCEGALAPRGEGARRIADLWWWMFWLGVFAFVVVMTLLVVVMVRRDQGTIEAGQRWVRNGAMFSAVMLVPVATLTVTTAVNLSWNDEDAISVRVVGHQFWWDVIYEDVDGMTFRTANEIHIPVDRTVRLSLESEDVIHSFWVPELHGKMDMVPGRVNELEIRADEPGTFFGQCAEFCGLAHVQMRLMVVAHDGPDFLAWAENEAAPAEVDVPQGTLETFANSCAPCHTIRGLFHEPIYEGDFGPDLTGIANRRMLGANIMSNTVEGLARWIVDPQGVKPGNAMPDLGLDGDDLNAVMDLLLQLD